MDDSRNQGSITGENAPAADSGQLLAEAIRVLTAAARLTCQPLRQAAGGGWAPDPEGPPRQHDWAEFMALALAGAAANLGGIEAVLAGRSGSWEAAFVRDLLIGTVGEDEASLWEHRTEPLTVTPYVDEFLDDVAPGFWRRYDAATNELNTRYDAIGIPHFTQTTAMSDAEVAAGLAALTLPTSEQETAAEAIGELRDRLEDKRIKELRDYGGSPQG